MTSTNWIKIICITGATIMIFAFVVVPEQYPWYYEVILFDIGLLLWLSTKSEKIRKYFKRTTTNQ